jgi:hypothetical protein
MTNQVAMEFIARVLRLAPELEIKQYRQLKDLQAAEKLFREYENTMDCIIFIRQSEAGFLSRINPKVPCFAGGCNNPAGESSKTCTLLRRKSSGVTHSITC